MDKTEAERVNKNRSRMTKMPQVKKPKRNLLMSVLFLKKVC
jgi:hypothetical protein